MALFESYERRVNKINSCIKEYGISSIEECKEICLAHGVDCDQIVRGTQPICFENAVWAYYVGAAIAIKKGCKKASDAAAAIGIGLHRFRMAIIICELCWNYDCWAWLDEILLW